MLVVGLTGGIASGKTTVSRMFRDHGVHVICADELAREAVEPGAPALEEIRRTFGASVIDHHGGLDRSRMAEVVFNDAARREILENIIHPRVAELMDQRVLELKNSGQRLVVVDVPLMYEKGWDTRCDLIIVVHVPRPIQEERLVLRDGMSSDEARSRLDAQMPIDEKKGRADRVVDNSGSVEQTLEQVRVLIEQLKNRPCRNAVGTDC